MKETVKAFWFDLRRKFAIGKNLLVLKQKYLQYPLPIELSAITHYDFVVYNFQGLITGSTKFNELYFYKLLIKLNIFDKDYMLPKIYESVQLLRLSI